MKKKKINPLKGIDDVTPKKIKKKSFMTGVGEAIQAIPQTVTGNNDWKIALKKFGISLIITVLGGVVVWLASPEMDWKKLMPLVVVPLIQSIMNWLKHYSE